MQIKNFLKTYLRLNAYVNNCYYKIRFHKSNSNVLKLNMQMNNWDTIKDIGLLSEFRKTIKTPFYDARDPNLANSLIYGILKSIVREFDRGDSLFLPAVEHGLILHDQIFSELEATCRPTFITFGEFRKNIIRKYSQRPVFCIGPYIEYAQQFYNEVQLKETKKRWGKVLLVFPTHSTDSSEVSFEEEKFCECVSKLAKNFNTVLINSYWWNINDPLIKKLAAEGYHICSAGFREDDCFLSRLKTIITMADLAVGDSVGTHIGYCISQNVPYYLLPLNTSITLLKDDESKDLDFMKYHLECIAKPFYNSLFITDKQIDICNKYWGLNLLKNNREREAIINISKEIFFRARGNTIKMNKCAKIVLEEYRQNDTLKYHLLLDALR